MDKAPMGERAMSEILSVVTNGGSTVMWNQSGSGFMMLKGNGRYIHVEVSCIDADRNRVTEILADLASETGTTLIK